MNTYYLGYALTESEDAGYGSTATQPTLFPTTAPVPTSSQSSFRDKLIAKAEEIKRRAQTVKVQQKPFIQANDQFSTMPINTNCNSGCPTTAVVATGNGSGSGSEVYATAQTVTTTSTTTDPATQPPKPAQAGMPWWLWLVIGYGVVKVVGSSSSAKGSRELSGVGNSTRKRSKARTGKRKTSGVRSMTV